MVRLPNVYADTSGVSRFDYIVQAVRRAGAHKVLFGSDGPWLHPGVEIHKIRLLGLPPPQESMILGGNILRLLREGRSGRHAATVSRPPIHREPEAGRLLAAGPLGCHSNGNTALEDQPEFEL